MEYELSFDAAPETIPGGTGILLVHPSTVETDRVDTAFLNQDTDRLLVISTRTTAREVRQKLDHYDVDDEAATILDTRSVERGYTRRQRDQVSYLSAPDDLDGIVRETREFLADHDIKRRVSLDSLTELIYYTDVEAVKATLEELLDALEEFDAVGLFHLSAEVHDEDVVAAFRSQVDGVLTLSPDGELAADFANLESG